ncbi:MAG: cytochrome b/b6 domain-containing protein [Burkholderiales bacterium]|nr:cytochrome b/b6 domain-containing protein [Burkholderiales bacterium]OUT77558.1 MAG: hypothetical protein CBB82_05260 [Betaproteobacteria bacterium TMED22]
MNPNYKTKIWDTSVRIFHWTITVLLGYQLITGLSENGPSDLHVTIGYCILGLVLFRIFWGFWGSITARFSNFLKSPIAVVKYVTSEQAADSAPGHNPLGGYSVIAMILSLVIQVTSGLFCDDDLLLSGGLSHLASDSFTSVANLIHAINSKVLLILIFIHVTAIVWYQLVKKQNLIRPMIVGYSTDKKVSPDKFQINEHPKRAFIIAIFCALSVIFLISWQ